MTVKELKNILNSLDDELIICVDTYDIEGFQEVDMFAVDKDISKSLISDGKTAIVNFI